MCSGIFVKLNFLTFGLRFVGILKWLVCSENSDNWTDYEYRSEDTFYTMGNVLFILQTPAYLQSELIYVTAIRYFINIHKM